jgi:hypothetical protein
VPEDNIDKGFVKDIQNKDVTYRFVKVAEEGKATLYVREDLANADFVRSILDQPPSPKYVRPVGVIAKLVETEPIVAVPFIGTTGLSTYSITRLGEKIVELRQYIRPLRDYVPLILRAITLGRELGAKGIPWIAVVTAYIPGRSKTPKPKLLILRHTRYYVKRYYAKKAGEVRKYPELLMFFDRHVFGGMKKGVRYYFVFSILVPKGAQVKKAYVTPAEPEPKGTATSPEAVAQPATEKPSQPVEDLDRQIKELLNALKKVSD